MTRPSTQLKFQLFKANREIFKFKKFEFSTISFQLQAEADKNGMSRFSTSVHKDKYSRTELTMGIAIEWNVRDFSSAKCRTMHDLHVRHTYWCVCVLVPGWHCPCMCALHAVANMENNIPVMNINTYRDSGLAGIPIDTISRGKRLLPQTNK